MQLEKRTWWIIGGAVFAAIVILSIIILTRGEDEEQKRVFTAPAVEVDSVRRGNITRKLSAVGTLKANQSVLLRAQVRGRIETVNFRGGEKVRKGAPLIILEKEEYAAALKEAQARLTLAKSDFSRAERLASANQGPQKLKDKARAELSVAEATVERAELNLNRTTIRAPFDGVVGLQHVSPGTLVSDNQDLITFVDITPIKVDFRVAAEFAHRLSRGQELSVEVDGFKKPFPALIEAIDAQIDPNSHTLEVRGLMMNKLGLLKSGLFGRVYLSVGSKEDVLLIPEGSLETDGDQTFVFRVEELDDRIFAVKTPVTVGLRESGNVEIIRGLTENDRVITAGQFKIRHGYPVRITSWDEEIESEAPEESDEEKEFPSEEKALEVLEEESEEETEEALAIEENDAIEITPEGSEDAEQEEDPLQAAETEEESDVPVEASLSPADVIDEGPSQTVETEKTTATEGTDSEATPQVEPSNVQDQTPTQDVVLPVEIKNEG